MSYLAGFVAGALTIVGCQLILFDAIPYRWRPALLWGLGALVIAGGLTIWEVL